MSGAKPLEPAMMSILQTERLTSADAARLHMGKHENSMAIAVLLMLDAPVERALLFARLGERLLSHRRFRQKVTEAHFGWGMPRWRENANFELGRHVHSVKLSSGDRPLEAFVSDLLSLPFAPNRPLWDLYLASATDGRAALIMKVHHALADGAALLGLLESLSDEGRRAETDTSSLPPDDGSSGRPNMVASLVAAGRLALKRADPRTLLCGPLGARKNVAFSSAVPLAGIISNARALQTTVGGVLLAAVAGALRKHLAPITALDGLVLHALLPIPVPMKGPKDLGNHYGSVFVPLPIGVADPRQRILRIRDDLRALRARGAAAAGLALATVAGLAPAPLERLGVTFLSRKASVMVSNVRGPARVLHLGGAAIRDVIVWAPSPGSVGLGITLMSYAGWVRLGIIADARAIGDPRPLTEKLELELSDLSRLASSAVPPPRGP